MAWIKSNPVVLHRQHLLSEALKHFITAILPEILRERTQRLGWIEKTNIFPNVGGNQITELKGEEKEKKKGRKKQK